MTAPYRYPQSPPQAPARPHQPAPHQGGPYQPAPYQPGPYQPAPWQQGPWQQGPYQHGPQAPYGRPGSPAARPARQPWVVAVVVIVAITVLAGIVLAASASTGTSGAQPRVGAGPVGGTGTAGESHCPGGSLEGCYSEGQMREFLDQAVKFVRGFSGDRYTRMPDAAGYLLVGTGGTEQSPCGAVDAMSYSYCPADDRIYIGQTQLWQFYSGIGDAAAVVGLAHEYGHHIQNVAGVPDIQTPSGQVVHENQADCIAGAFVGWAKEKGFLEDSDARDISGLVSAIASSEGDPGRDHGTLTERADSLSTGIRDGLPGCSAFFPGTPVHQG